MLPMSLSCKKIYKMKIGINKIILPARRTGIDEFSDESPNLYRPTASVGTEGVNIKGVSYSFQYCTNKIKSTVVKVLEMRGIIILTRIEKLPAPSIFAASVKLSGMTINEL